MLALMALAFCDVTARSWRPINKQCFESNQEFSRSDLVKEQCFEWGNIIH